MMRRAVKPLAITWYGGESSLSPSARIKLDWATLALPALAAEAIHSPMMNENRNTDPENGPHAGARVVVTGAKPLESGAATVTLLAALAGIGQFAASVYTPSFPAIARSFGADASAVQSTLAVFLAAFGIGQLIFGPLADRYGRRPVLFCGLGLFLAATLACALSSGLGTLLSARAVQGFSAASAVVIARAAARDSFDGVRLVRLTAMVLAAFALVPGVSPLIGAAALEIGGWRAAFWCTLGAGAVVLAGTFLVLPETGKFRLARLDGKAIVSGFGTIGRDRTAMFGIFAGAMAFGTYSAFTAGAPALYMGQLGVSAVEFALYPAVSAAAIAAGAIRARRLALATPPSAIAGRGVALMLCGLVLMLLLLSVGLVHKHVVNGALIAYSAGFGLFVPVVNATVMARFSENLGVVSATFGFFLLAGAALGAAAVSLMQTMLPIPALPLSMLLLTIAGTAASRAFFASPGDSG